MAVDLNFTEEDMEIGKNVGYPIAYAQLCRHRDAGFFSRGPPFAFTPYILQQNEVGRARELDQMFPISDPGAKQTKNPKIFQSLLWKQLNHLGNAGFDPAVIRVDPYGNVLYYHADSSSPLAWDIDHWFPCSRGGLTVPSNLRILQWQACKKKHNKLEFIIPWWDFQLGISVNQFLSIFASSNSDFRRRGFYFLFSDGENEELNASQSVQSHSFPQPFIETKEELGLAPAAIVTSRSEYCDYSSVLRSLDYNRQKLPDSRKLKTNHSKENENPDFVSNPYQAIVIARDSLKQREETAKMKAEIQKLDGEVDDLRRKNEDEKLTIQDLEQALIKRKRKVEKCRRLAESQTSYRTMLEKMIRDAMHQSVIYKEQVRLNQAASNSVMARLEAQKAICDAAEKELYQKHRQRKELEKQLKWPEWEQQPRKRSRMDDSSLPERESRTVLYLPKVKQRRSMHKELRVFLEEEQRASETALLQNEEEDEDVLRKTDTAIVATEEVEGEISGKLEKLEIVEEKQHTEIQLPFFRKPEMADEDEESRKLRGKGNVEKWLQMLLENNDEDDLNHPNRAKPRTQNPEFVNNGETEADDITQKDKMKVSIVDGEEEKTGKSEKERRLVRSESARVLRRIPSSPSMILGMRKGVDFLRKKTKLRTDDEEEEDSSFIKSSIKTIKRVVKL